MWRTRYSWLFSFLFFSFSFKTERVHPARFCGVKSNKTQPQTILPAPQRQESSLSQPNAFHHFPEPLHLGALCTYNYFCFCKKNLERHEQKKIPRPIDGEKADASRGHGSLPPGVSHLPVGKKDTRAIKYLKAQRRGTSSEASGPPPPPFPTPHARARQSPRAYAGCIEEVVVHLCAEVTRADSVHPDAVTRPLQSQDTGEVRKPRLRRTVRCQPYGATWNTGFLLLLLLLFVLRTMSDTSRW